MSSVWFIGDSGERTITAHEWGVIGAPATEDSVWNQANGWSVPESDFTQAQLDYLSTDVEFLIGKPDGPSTFGIDPEHSQYTMTTPASIYYVRTKALLDTAQALLDAAQSDIDSAVDSAVASAVASTQAVHDSTVAVHDSTVGVHDSTVAVHDSTVTVHDSTVAVYDALLATQTVYDLSLMVFGATTPRAVGYGDNPMGIKLSRACTLTSVTFRGNTADASGNLVVELRKNGVQVSGTPTTIAAANQIAGGTSTGSWAFNAGDIVTAYVTAVGTTPGNGLSVDIKGTC